MKNYDGGEDLAAAVFKVDWGLEVDIHMEGV
jgi:hypothetical protein